MSLTSAPCNGAWSEVRCDSILSIYQYHNTVWTSIYLRHQIKTLGASARFGGLCTRPQPTTARAVCLSVFCSSVRPSVCPSVCLSVYLVVTVDVYACVRWCRTNGFLSAVPKNGKYPKKLCFRFGDDALRWTPDRSAMSLWWWWWWWWYPLLDWTDLAAFSWQIVLHESLPQHALLATGRCSVSVENCRDYCTVLVTRLFRRLDLYAAFCCTLHRNLFYTRRRCSPRKTSLL